MLVTAFGELHCYLTLVYNAVTFLSSISCRLPSLDEIAMRFISYILRCDINSHVVIKKKLKCYLSENVSL